MTTTPPPFTLTGAIDRTAIARATDLLIGLVARPEVAARWEDASSCAGMSVGALTWHLVNQPQRVVEVLSAPASHDAPITLDEHYAQAAWLNEDLDGPANRGVRDRGAQQAEAGPAAAVAAARAARAGLEQLVTSAGPAVRVPWTGLTIGTDDFLVTRLMEIVVHSDDLAASLDGVEVPAFSSDVLTPVLGLLTDLALRRHGQDALIRTLTRPQRAPRSVSAF